MPKLRFKEVVNELAKGDESLGFKVLESKGELKTGRDDDTFPKLWREACRRWQHKVALRQKDYGIWEEYTWEEYYKIAGYFSLGLMSLGMEPGIKVGIVGNNEVPWLFAMMGIQCGRGVVSCGIYPDGLASEFQYQLNHSEVAFLVCEDQEQVDKTLEIKEQVPSLKKIICWDTRGLLHYDEPSLMDFEDVLKLGAKYGREHPDIFMQRIEEATGDELAFLYYSSGTTGQPKGAMISHYAQLAESLDLNSWDPTDEDDQFLSFTPLAWPMDVKVFVVRHLLSGGIINFPEEPETALENFREVPVNMSFLAPRLQESLVRTVMVKVSDSGWLKRMAYNLFLPVGFKMADLKFAHQEPSWFLKVLNFIGYWVLFRPILDKLGLLHLKRAWSGGAAVSPDAFRFLTALGVHIKQLYGQIESGMTFVQKDDEVKFDTVGRPHLHTELRIDARGELLLKTPSRMVGYYKAPQATEEYFLGGWQHTGDAARIDDEGQLVIIDRVKDLMEIDDGTGFSPMFVENKLKYSTFVRDAIIVGDGRPFVAALAIVDYKYTGKWAEDHRIPYTTYTDLSQKPEVYDLVEKEIHRVNKFLPENTRIRRFVNLYKEIDADDAELTRSGKLRRGFVGEFYKDVIDAIYSGQPTYATEAEITYRDGRKTTIKTNLLIRTVGEGEK